MYSSFNHSIGENIISKYGGKNSDMYNNYIRELTSGAVG